MCMPTRKRTSVGYIHIYVCMRRASVAIDCENDLIALRGGRRRGMLGNPRRIRDGSHDGRSITIAPVASSLVLEDDRGAIAEVNSAVEGNG